MTPERETLLRLYGAKLDPDAERAEGMNEAVEERAELPRTRRLLHAEAVQQPGQPGDPPPTTAEEIWRDTDRQIDVLVAGVGTGGTITGVASC